MCIKKASTKAAIESKEMIIVVIKRVIFIFLLFLNNLFAMAIKQYGKAAHKRKPNIPMNHFIEVGRPA